MSLSTEERVADIKSSRSSMESRLSRLGSRLGDDRDWQAIAKFINHYLAGSARGDYVDAFLNVMPYREYLQTNHWKDKSATAKTKADNRCKVCNGVGELHTHHRTYDRRGGERDEDLIVLCAGCHKLFHKNAALCTCDEE